MLKWFEELFNHFAGWLESVLPLSPFSNFNFDSLAGKIDSSLWAYLNWLLPLQDFVLIFAGFLTSLALYYLYSIIARWVKAIN